MCGDVCKSPVLLVFVFQAAWVIWTFSVSIGKVAAFGMAAFIEHFTNWAWFAYGIFFLLTLSLFGLTCAESVTAACFLPLTAIAWFVAIAVSVLLFTDPDFITDLFDVMDPGLVINGNDLFHVYPVIALLFFAGLHQYVIWRGLRRCFVWARGSCFWTGLVIFYQVLGAALAFLGLYFLVLAVFYGKTVNDVYGTDASIGLGILAFAVVSLIVSGIPLLVLVCCFDLIAPLEKPRPLRRPLPSSDQVNFNIYSVE